MFFNHSEHASLPYDIENGIYRLLHFTYFYYKSVELINYFRVYLLYVSYFEKILIPVGTAIIIVAEVKYARVSTSIPTVNI